MSEFEVFALDHGKHGHCEDCGGCILNPAPIVQRHKRLWCVGCMRKIAANTENWEQLPWVGGMIFADMGEEA